MTPDETSPAPIDERLLRQVIACDAMLHASSSAGTDPQCERRASASEVDDRARSRLLLLLTMLEAMEPAGDRPGKSASIPAGKDRDDTRAVLGRFDVIEDLGSGGFGFVVRARDRLLGREVALKMPLPERALARPDIRAFLREARAAARLDHPNLVRVHDAGELGPLGYFIASEFCAGPTLRRWVKSRNEPVPTRLAACWLAALADAVRHAHERGILHRDIKPDNVILTGVSGPDEFIPRLTDFGLAKLIEEPGDETKSGALMGTPHYMAPEQAAGRRRDVGPATDVYALGATLYELLTARPPFRGETNAETMRLVLETEPLPPRSLRPGLPRDLDTICLKCLRKEPARRYGTAAALRDDLQRFLAGQPILGRPVSSWERARIWMRRRPAVTGLVGTVVLLVGGLIGGVVSWASWLGWHNRKLEIQIARADRQTREAEKQRRIAEERRQLSDRHNYAASLRRARQALDARQVELAQDLLHDLRPVQGADDRRDFAWRYLWRQAHRDFSQLWGHEATVSDVGVSADGTMFATADLQGRILVWKPAAAMELDTPRAVLLGPRSNYNVCQISPDGRYIATFDRRHSGAAIKVYESASGRLAAQFDCEVREDPISVRFDGSSQHLAVFAGLPDAPILRWWDLAEGARRPHSWSLEKGAAFSGFSADGRLLALNQAGRISLHDPWTGKVRISLALDQRESFFHNDFSADSQFFAVTVTGNRILMWETETGRDAGRFDIPGGIAGIRLSPRGSCLAVLEDSGRVTVFDRSSKLRQVLSAGLGRSIAGLNLAFSPDERLLAFALDLRPGGPQPQEVWDVATARRLGTFPGRASAGELAFLPRSRSLILTGGTKPRIWRLDAPRDADALADHVAEVWSAAFSPDGTILATGSDDTKEPRTVRFWDPASARLLASWRAHTATVAALAFSPDGSVLATGSLDSGKPGSPNLMLWDVASHRHLANLQGHTGRVRSVAFSPDGRLLASASDDLTARLWDVTAQTTRAVLSGHTRNLTTVTFSPDGQTLASASNDSTVRLWDVATGQTRQILQDVGNVLSVAFAPDSSLLASGNENGEIKLWNPVTGDLKATIRGEAEQLRCVAFTPDGRDVVAAGKAKIIRIWDVVTGQELLTLDGHKAQINALAFSPNGSIFASCCHDGAVRLWRASGPEVLAKP
jgi:WD40 repeat protein/serine/threonine protein kinase